jgi:hypothetical protein
MTMATPACVMVFVLAARMKSKKDRSRKVGGRSIGMTLMDLDRFT